MEHPGDVILGDVVGAVTSVPGVLTAGPGQLLREGGDEVVEGPGHDGVVVGGDVEGDEADGATYPCGRGRGGPGSRAAGARDSSLGAANAALPFISCPKHWDTVAKWPCGKFLTCIYKITRYRKCVCVLLMFLFLFTF